MRMLAETMHHPLTTKNITKNSGSLIRDKKRADRRTRDDGPKLPAASWNGRHSAVVSILLASLTGCASSDGQNEGTGTDKGPLALEWSVNDRLRVFSNPDEAKRYLAILDKINPNISREYSHRYEEKSPIHRDEKMFDTLWNRHTETYEDLEGRLNAPQEFNIKVRNTDQMDQCFWIINGQEFENNRSCTIDRQNFKVPAQISVRVEDASESTGIAPQSAVENVALETTIQPKNTLIVSFGDSYASGEGTPDKALWFTDEFTDWWDRRCHRSLYSGPALAAAMLADHDPHRSVTFLSFACSGATVPQLLAKSYSEEGIDADACSIRGQEPPREIRDLYNNVYRRLIPETDIPKNECIKPQIRAAAETLCFGQLNLTDLSCSGVIIRPDYVMLSIGGNDLRFVPLMSDMLLNNSTQERRDFWANEIKREIGKFERRIALVADEIETIIKPTNVLYTEYPDPMRDDGRGRIDAPGDFCDDNANWWYNIWHLGLRRSTLGTRITPITADEAEYAYRSFLKELNDRIYKTATANGGRGWYVVNGLERASSRFGYCSRYSFFRTAEQARQHQGPQSTFPRVSFGTAHPNMQGYRLYGCFIVARVRSIEEKLPWRAPLPWPRACADNVWEPLLASDQWLERYASLPES